MRCIIFTFFTLFICFLTKAQTNQVPVISNLEAHIQWSDHVMTITYDVMDAENDDLEIVLQLSDDNGVDYGLTDQLNAPSGDVGFPISPGTSKEISLSTTNLSSGPIRVRLTALDNQTLDIHALVAQVDSNSLKERLSFIQGIRHRIANPTQLQLTRDSIASFFTRHQLGLSRTDVPFNAYTGENIIGNLYGINSSEKTVIVDAHYDSVNNSPGADDNGSGVVGFMEIADILAPYPSLSTMRYIGFDLEESGLLGSAEYVSDFPSSEELLGVFNFEMIGFYSNEPNTQELPAGFNLLFPAASAAVVADSFRGNFLTNIGNTSSQALVDLLQQSAQTYVPNLKVLDVVVPGNGTIAPDLLRSDHAPFWLAGKKALMLTDGANFRNECYHTSDDTADKLNFEFMQQVTQATLAAVAELAEVQHGSWQTTVADETLNSSNTTIDCAVHSWKNGSGIQLDIGDCQVNEEATFQIFSLDGKELFSKQFKLENDKSIVFNGDFSTTINYVARILDKKGRMLWTGKL